ncbi:MAG: hypothetical protein UW44_C0010G0019 [Candidatus Collierbacteria bacterium GW2011_GWB2_44_22]|uniref:Uncharacterized protein n=1 Tax=Candidatus Collierbacteria bacterium GW2011_GWB2_44_22 TaxID=1618387 RepID=A0A0G1HWT9_9BACT|nr:MAG: hypothetical protein UW44_C0010G0019 [Candidatus Collierbacteria bacterium GW2011_GWB2_44_22]
MGADCYFALEAELTMVLLSQKMTRLGSSRLISAMRGTPLGILNLTPAAGVIIKSFIFFS